MFAQAFFIYNITFLKKYCPTEKIFRVLSDSSLSGIMIALSNSHHYEIINF